MGKSERVIETDEEEKYVANVARHNACPSDRV